MTDDTTLGERVRDVAIENGLASEDEIEGCTEQEIRKLEEKTGLELPETYRSFLAYVGKGCGDFLRGHDYTYPVMLKQKKFAQKRIDHWDVDFEFELTDFVFLGSQAVLFYYFDADAGEDPPVYCYQERDDEAHRVADTFSEWAVETTEDGLSLP